MTTREFSDGFDALLNSYSQSANFGSTGSGRDINLDEYEKSLFLTEAQEQFIVTYYNGKNPSLDSFEKTEEIRRYLSSLVKTSVTELLWGYAYNNDFYEDAGHNTPYTGDAEAIYIDIPTGDSYIFNATGSTFTKKDSTHIGANSIVLPLPEKLWFITYESAVLQSSNSCLNNKEIEIIPVAQDDYYRTKENPFKTTGARRALRLDIEGNKVELITKYNIQKYLVRYIEKPTPIILEDLPDGLSINGETKLTECALIDSLHKPILELAVMLALKSKGINLDNNSK